MKKFNKILWRTFCETDERYIDLFRVFYALSMIVFLGIAVASAWRAEEFEPEALGIGIASLLFGGAAGVGIRGKLEDGSESRRNQNVDDES